LFSSERGNCGLEDFRTRFILPFLLFVDQSEGKSCKRPGDLGWDGKGFPLGMRCSEERRERHAAGKEREGGEKM
jgi:hypothetical protein